MIWFALIALGGALSSARGGEETKNASRLEESTVLAKRRELSSLEYATEDANLLPILPRDFSVLEGAIDSIEEGECREEVGLVANALKNFTTWAVKFYDSSGKTPEGIFGGSVYQLGNFDECLAIGDEAPNDENGLPGPAPAKPPGLNGRYCLGEFRLLVPDDYFDRVGTVWSNFRRSEERGRDSIEKLYAGVCVPASCSSRQVERLFRRVIAVALPAGSGSANPRLEFSVPENRCYARRPIPADTFDLVYLGIVSAIGSMIVLGTMFHAARLRKSAADDPPKGTFARVLVAFSLVANLKKLCGPANDDGLDLDCVSGIKFVSMMLIVAGHTLVFVIGGPVLNPGFWTEAIGRVENSIFLNNPLLVDTFLFLSGFLFARLLLRELDKRKSVNFLLLYAFRYTRLTPAYAVTIGLYLTWLPGLNSGPLWYRIYEERDRCRASWWTNLLYINNYVGTDKLCMFQSWYLSVDTQLFLLAPAIVYPLWKWRRPGEFVLAGVTLLSMALPFAFTLVDRLDPTLMMYAREIQDVSVNEYFRDAYVKTHMRATAYCFGIIYAYALYRLEINNHRLSLTTVRLGWILASFSLVVSMCSVSVFYGPRRNFTALEAAIYSPLHRALWSAGTGWLLLACITDNSGPLRNFLKRRPFVTLSRLTYSAYLVNGLVELHSISTTRTPQHLDRIDLLSKILSHLTMTFLGALLLSTMFESPILGLEKIVRRTESKKATSPKNRREATTNEA